MVTLISSGTLELALLPDIGIESLLLVDVLVDCVIMSFIFNTEMIGSLVHK